MNRKPLFPLSFFLLAFAAKAATCTYDGEWDTAPSAAADEVVVTAGALTWGEGLPDGVKTFTLSGGTVTLEKDFVVFHEYNQSAGVFDCGTHDFRIGNTGPDHTTSGLSFSPIGQFYLTGGTFTPPDGGTFRWRPAQSGTARWFKVADAADFDLSKTHLEIHVSGSGCQNSMDLAGRTIGSLRTFCTGTSNQGNASINILGTNTVLGTYTYAGGTFGNRTTVNFGCSELILKGDLILTNRPYGSFHGMAFRFNSDSDQTIYTYIATNNNDCSCAGIIVDKPAGTKLKIKGPHFRRTSGGYKNNYLFEVLSGTLDMSELEKFSVSAYSSYLRVYPGAEISAWPTDVEFTGYNIVSRFKNQTFHNLHLHSSDSKIVFPYATTNTVTGWLKSTSFGFTGVKDTAFVPESSNTSVPPVLRLEGPGLNIATNTSTYSGLYNNSCGNGVLMFCSDDDQVICGTGHTLIYLPTLRILKPADKAVTCCTDDGRIGIRAVGSGVSGGHLEIERGIFHGPRLIDVGSYNTYIKVTGGVDDFTNTAFNITGWTSTFHLKSPITSLKFDHNLASGSGNGCYVDTGCTCTVTRSFCPYRGLAAGKGVFELQGDVEIGGYFNGGVGTILYSGTNVQHFSNISNRVLTTGTHTIAKSGGRLVLDTDMGLTNGTPKLNFVSGELDLNGNRLVMSGNLDLNGGATLGLPYAANAASPITVAGKVTDNATEAQPLVVHLTSPRRELGQERVNLIDYGTLAAGHDPRAATARAAHPVSRVRVYDDDENLRLWLSYHFSYGLQILLRGGKYR